MDAAQRRFLAKAAAVALLAFACAAAFAAYLKPDMVAMFGDLMAFCTTLLK